MECGDLSPLSFWRPGHSGDKSPHSKRCLERGELWLPLWGLPLSSSFCRNYPPLPAPSSAWWLAF